jgi:hypothetical protein
LLIVPVLHILDIAQTFAILTHIPLEWPRISGQMFH